MTNAPESAIGWPGIAIQGAKEGAKVAKKRHKQQHQESTIDDDDDINEQANGPSVVHATEVAGSGKRQTRPPMDHFERLLEEACLNHTYAIKDKL
jgi:hypothetical protein